MRVNKLNLREERAGFRDNLPIILIDTQVAGRDISEDVLMKLRKAMYALTMDVRNSMALKVH